MRFALLAVLILVAAAPEPSAWDTQDPESDAAHYTNTDQGRFISRDPIGVWSDPASIGNPYTFAANAPFQYRDPTGNIVETLADVGFCIWGFKNMWDSAKADDLAGLAWDSGGTILDCSAVFVPFVPAGVSGLRHAAKTDNAVDAAKVDSVVDDFAEAARANPAAFREATEWGHRIDNPPRTSMLGHSPIYRKIATEQDLNHFYVPQEHWKRMSPDEKWLANQKFLDRAIERGDQFVLSNLPRPGPSGLLDELNYLKPHGITPQVWKGGGIR